MSSNTCKPLKFAVNSPAYADNVRSISHKFAAIRDGKWRHKELNSPSVTVLRPSSSQAHGKR